MSELVDYLIRPLPKYSHGRRVGAGIAILVIFYILILVVIITYLRLLFNITRNPGFLPRAPAPTKEEQETEPSDRPPRRKRKHRRTRTAEKPDKTDVDIERGADGNADSGAIPLDIIGLESFYTKDVFVCQEDGRPLYCSTCSRYKPDRAHHCREVDRCVLKMDHFCPW